MRTSAHEMWNAPAERSVDGAFWEWVGPRVQTIVFGHDESGVVASLCHRTPYLRALGSLSASEIDFHEGGAMRMTL